LHKFSSDVKLTVKNCTQIDALACTQEREGNRTRSDKKRNRKASNRTKKMQKEQSKKKWWGFKFRELRSRAEKMDTVVPKKR